MKFVKALSNSEKITLTEVMKNVSDYRTRMRAHAILLSDKRRTIKDISSIYEVDRDTVSIWYNKWETLGIVGIFDLEHTGRPKTLTKEEEKMVLDKINQDPRSIKRVAEAIKKATGKSVSIKTIKRIAKAANLVWKRVRKSLKHKRDDAAFQVAKSEIAQLLEQQKAGKINVLFFDESGFTLEPVVPYAWQPVGETMRIPSSKSKRLNVLGFMNSNGKEVTPYIFEGSITSAEVIACFDNFVSAGLEKPTRVIIDNASMHTSTAFKEKIAEWESKNLLIQNIPPYSPELNLIEILWKHIKYFWLPFSAYENVKSLKEGLNDVFKNVGTKYQINFG